MNLNRSVFLLFLRQVWWRLLLVLAGVAAGECLLFRVLYDPAGRAADAQGVLSLQAYMTHLSFPLTILVGVGVLLFELLLTRTWQPRGHNRPDYTLDRLSLSPWRVWLLQGSYHALCFLLFWGVQVLVFLSLSRMFGQLGGPIGPQDLYLATWRSPLFHFFLPMEDARQWVCSVGFLLLLSFGCARVPEERRGICIAVGAALFLIVIALMPQLETGSRIVILLAVCLCLFMAKGRRKEGPYEKEETFSE